MTASKTYPVPENILQSTHLTASQYDEMYKQSVEQPEAFWAEHASMLEWYQKPGRWNNWRKYEILLKHWMKLFVTSRATIHRLKTLNERDFFLILQSCEEY